LLIQIIVGVKSKFEVLSEECGRLLKLHHVPPNQVAHRCPHLRLPPLGFQTSDTIHRTVCLSLQRQISEAQADLYSHPHLLLPIVRLKLFSVIWQHIFHKLQSRRDDPI
jgi:hypothetical protein